MYSGICRVSWNLDVLRSIRQIGPGVIIALGIIESRARLASALGVDVDATQVGVFVGGVCVGVAGGVTNHAGGTDAVVAVLGVAAEGAVRLDGAEEGLVLAWDVVWREAECLTLLASRDIIL